MTKKQYSEEFKEQLIKKCPKIQNILLVACRHNISPNIIHTWIRKAQKRGSVNPLSRNKKSTSGR